MELKSSDLRIGNLLMELTSDDIFYVTDRFFTILDVNLLCSRPIPLSVELLKKAGYKQLKRIEKTYSLSNFEDNSAIYFTGVRFVHIITGTHLEFIHELQNLHYCLHKQELKFNP